MDIKRIKFIDKTFVLVLVCLIVYGLAILASASNSISGDPYFHIKKQIVIIVLSLAAAIFLLRFDYNYLRRYSTIFYIISLVLLVVVLLFGNEVKGATRGWVSIGPLPAIQPAEITKVLLVLAFADFLAQRKNNLNTLAQILPCFFYMGISFVLIMLQPDLGTALVYIAITIVMMYVAGANPRILTTIIAVALLIVVLLLFLHFQYNMPLPLEDYQIKRLTIFVNPYADGQGGRGLGWNTIQSLIAIGSGGMMGKGLFNGTQVQLNFLPEHHTDFIYAVVGEELGFIGAITIIILYGILLLRSITIAYNARELYGTLVVIGITAMWLFHIYENIGMTLGLMPITGIPLPFISYGGSFMLTNLLAVGLIINVNICGKKIVF